MKTRKNYGIVVKAENMDKIEAMIREGQKRCNARIIDVDDIKIAIEDIKNRWMGSLGLTKTDMDGCKFGVCPSAGVKFAGSYNGIPYCTTFNLLYKNGTFRLTYVNRTTTTGSEKNYIHAFLTDKAKAAILKKSELYL